MYRHSEGPHRALAFPDFVGLLVGMGLEQYRKGKALPEAAPEDIEEEDGDTLNLMDIPRAALPDLFREFDEAMEEDPPMDGPRLRLVHAGETA